jgi:hypothetical protein
MKPTTISVRLSARGLANIQEKEEYNDFEFVVGESHYRCPWFIADFLSPRIAQLHSIDNTIGSFVINTKDAKSEFSKFLLLGRGDEIVIDDDNRDFYELLIQEVENAELSAMIFDNGQTEMSVETAIGQLGRHVRFNFDSAKLIELIASHFDDKSVVKLREVKEIVYNYL